MRIEAATHHQIAGRIQQLIREEQYGQAQDLLPSFAQAVVEACNASGQEQEFLEAKQFLQSAVTAVKTRRAHHLSQLGDLGRERAYVGEPERRPSIDFAG